MAETPRQRHLRVKYGLTERDYASLLQHGGGVCWICQKPPKEGKNLQVDHDHRSGEVRGLLHPMCNKWLSYFWTPTLLRQAADYLDFPGTGYFVPKKKKKRRKR